MASKGLAIRHTDLILSKLMDGSVSAGDRSKRLAALPLLLFSVSLVGCSGLTRPKAQHELDEQFKAEKISKTSMDEPPKLLLNYGLRSPYCYMEPSSARWVLNGSSKTHGPDDKQRILVRSGYLTVSKIGPVTYTLMLTQKGHAAVSGEPYGHTVKPNCDSWQVDMPFAEWDNVTVTGVVQEGIHARVEAKLCEKLTPFGAELRRTLPEHDKEMIASTFFERANFYSSDGRRCETREIPFDKYDDGWRAGRLFGSKLSQR